MKVIKNIIDDAIEYNSLIKKYNSKDKLIDIEPIKKEKVITITLDEYKELLVYKGKYLGLAGVTETTKLYVMEKRCQNE